MGVGEPQKQGDGKAAEAKAMTRIALDSQIQPH